MAEIGYALSSEEHAAPDLVRYARNAEDAGFTFALISDHYHPWTDRQGHSALVWSVLGGIAEATTHFASAPESRARSSARLPRWWRRQQRRWER